MYVCLCMYECIIVCLFAFSVVSSLFCLSVLIIIVIHVSHNEALRATALPVAFHIVYINL